MLILDRNKDNLGLWLHILSFLFILFTSTARLQAQTKSPLEKLEELYALEITEQERGDLIKQEILAPLLRRNTDSLLIMAKKNLQLAQGLGNTQAIANANIGLGTAHNVSGNAAKALELYFTALKIYEKLDDQDNVAYALFAIGNAYTEQEEYQLSIEYYQKSLIQKETLGNYDQRYYATMINVANQHGELKDYDKALQYLYKAKTYFEQKNEAIYNLLIGNIGFFYGKLYEENRSPVNILTKEQLIDSALAYQTKSLQLAEDRDDSRRKAFTLFGLGEVYRISNNYPKANEYYASSIALAEPLKNMELTYKSSYGQYLSYKALDQPDMALEAYEYSTSIQDSLKRIENQKALVAQKLNYEHDKVMLQVEERNKSQKLLLHVGLLGMAALLVIMYLLRSRYFSRKKQEMQQAFAHNLITAQEGERMRLSRELHDDIGQQLILLKKKAQIEDPELATITATILEDMRGITKALHPSVLKQLGLTQTLQQLVNKIDEHAELFFTAAIEDIDNLLPPDQEVNIYRIVQEVLNNIVKHANARSVDVNIQRKKKEIHLGIEDNGVGFDIPEKLENSNSLGLLTLQERVNMLGGSLQMMSNTEGTKVTITVPYT